ATATQSSLAAAYQRGIAAADRGDWPAAVTEFQAVAAVDPNYADVSERLAEAIANLTPVPPATLPPGSATPVPVTPTPTATSAAPVPTLTEVPGQIPPTATPSPVPTNTPLPPTPTWTL